MSQDHGLSANGKLLRRFYEPLILLSVLDPTRGAQRPDLMTDRGLQGREKLWRNFLDQLSFLCDAEKGGDTVTAIAAQRTVGSTIFWLASNSKARSKAQTHVQWIFSQLNRLHDADQEEVEKIRNVLTTRCIEFSSRRIKAYATLLLKDIERLRTQSLTKGGEDERLLESLQAVLSNRNAPFTLCTDAYEFRRTEAVQILNRRHMRHGPRGQWSDIRHNIGRLGCWIKAVKVLLQAAQIFPQQLEGAVVDLVLPRGPSDVPPVRSNFELNSLVKRMLSQDQYGGVDDLVQSLLELESVSPWMTEFQDTYSTFQPRPHAELLVLEHFFEHDFEFVHDDKYIGCSKPSCYCCGLYMKFHPGHFEQRACHGNLWPNWGPPIPLPYSTSRKVGMQLQRPQEHPTFQLLQRMTAHIRVEVREQVRSRRPRRGKVPDTSTGMSSVIISSDVAGVANALPADATVDDGLISPLLVRRSKEGAESAFLHFGKSQFSSDVMHPEYGPVGALPSAPPSSAQCSAQQATECEGGREDECEDEGSEVIVFVGRQLR